MDHATMDHATMDRIVNEHFGFEAADDVDGVVATLAPDAAHHLVGSPLGPVHGHDAIRRFYESLFAACRGENVVPVNRWYGDGFLVDESLWTGEIVDAAPFGLPGRKGRVTFRILHVFDFAGDRIQSERVWCDTVAIAAALAP